MDICAIKTARALLERTLEPERTPMLRLHALSIDILLLQRQLAFALTGEGQEVGAAPAPMIARSIAGRLAEGAGLLQQQRSLVFRLDGGAPGSEAAALTEFRRYFDKADNIVRRLRVGGVAADGQAAAPFTPNLADGLHYDADLIRDLGPQRIRRLRALATAEDQAAKEILFASGLFLVASRHVFAAFARRQAPEAAVAVERPGRERNRPPVRKTGFLRLVESAPSPWAQTA